MTNDDLLREIEKIAEAVELAFEYHVLTNEANAKLHDSDRVMYSPLTNKLHLAREAIKKLRFELGVQDEL